ncbi:DUF7691 family protein [Kitasatospora sp. NBC_00458]|uniref:DUF7691 family protein n=1 Tax=Kitasatospora sp. NBC_00458 TaxID=2903568 RepID=UPI002E173A5E
MAEQYLSAFGVDADVLLAVAGSHDEGLVRAALGRIEELTEAGSLLRATGPAEVGAALREVVAGRPDPARPGGYTWLLELLGPVLGTPLGSAVLPGRHWDDLTDAFRVWGLPALAALWGRPWPFPAGAAASADDPWPFPSFTAAGELAVVRAELAGFDADRIHEDADLLPGGDDDAAEEVEELVAEALPAWVDGALAAGRGLLLVRDGGR